MKRNRRAGVEDLWRKTVHDADGNPRTEPSKQGRHRKAMAGTVRRRPRPGALGGVHAQSRRTRMARQARQRPSSPATTSRPAMHSSRVQQWCDLWIEGYKVHRESTVRQARTHIHQIVDEFGGMQLSALRPSHVKTWVARLQAKG